MFYPAKSIALTSGSFIATGSNGNCGGFIYSGSISGSIELSNGGFVDINEYPPRRINEVPVRQFVLHSGAAYALYDYHVSPNPQITQTYHTSSILDTLDWYAVAGVRGKNYFAGSDLSSGGSKSSDVSFSIWTSPVGSFINAFDMSADPAGSQWAYAVHASDAVAEGVLRTMSFFVHFPNGESPSEDDCNIVFSGVGRDPTGIIDLGSDTYLFYYHGTGDSTPTSAGGAFRSAGPRPRIKVTGFMLQDGHVIPSLSDYEYTSGTALANAWLDQTPGGRHALVPTATGSRPIVLDHDGTDYFYFPGTSGNYLSTPDAVALSVTGDLEIVVHMTMPTSTTNNLVTKYQTTGNNRSYRLNISSGGFMQLAWSTNGEAGGFVAATATSAIANNSAGAEVWVKATIDVDNGASGYDVKFWESLDGVSWSQVGSTVTGGGATSIYDGSAAVYIGWAADGLTNYMAGVVYRAIIKDGIDGTTVLDVNASDADEDSSTFTEASSNAATVTINRSSSGYMTWVVKRPWSIAATDDYMDLGDDGLWDIPDGGEFTAVVVGLQYASATNAYLESLGTTSWTLYDAGSNAMYFYVDAENPASGKQPSPIQPGTKLAAFAGVYTPSEITVYRRDVTGNNASSSIANDQSGDVTLTGLRLLGGYTRYADAGACGVAITHRALTPEQIDKVRDALLAKNSGQL